MINVKQVVAKLLKNGAKQLTDLEVKSVSVVEKETYKLVVLKLNNEVPMMVRKEVDGIDTYERGVGNTLFISSFSINAVLANNKDTATARKIIMEDDSLLEDFLTYAHIDVIQEPVYAGEDDGGNPLMYSNPFSENPEPREIEHDSYYTHITSIEIGDDGWDIIEGINEARKEIIKERAKERFTNRTNSRKGLTTRRSTTPRPSRIESVEVDDTKGDDNDGDDAK